MAKGVVERITYAPVGSPLELPFTGLGYLSVRYGLAKTFGDFPIRLSRDRDVGRLRAMGNAVGKDCSVAYCLLADQLERWGEMELKDG